LSYDQQDFLQDCGVSEGVAYEMSAWEFCLQNGGVSESFTHKMAAWKICLQDGGVSGNFAYKMAAMPRFWRVLPTRWRRGKFAYKMATFLGVLPKMAA